MKILHLSGFNNPRLLSIAGTGASRRGRAVPGLLFSILCSAAAFFTLDAPVLACTTYAACLKVQLTLKDGYLAVDHEKTELALGAARFVFEDQCKLSPDDIKKELVPYLDRLLHERGTVLEQRINKEKKKELPELIKSRKDFADLNKFTGSWKDAEKPFREWATANTDLTTPEGLHRVYVGASSDVICQNDPCNDSKSKDIRYEDGPLIPFFPADRDSVSFEQEGWVLFELAAPVTGEYRKLRPESNIREWERMRGDLSDNILGKLECRLWYRDAVVDPITDYLEMRGMSVEPFRRDVANKPAPSDRVGIAPERPRFTAQGVSHNRVIISPDPLLEGVMIAASPGEEATVKRILYLLLSSADYAEVIARPADYFCLMKPLIQKEETDTAKADKFIFLSLFDRDRDIPGEHLRLAQMYMTRRFLSRKLQYLDEIGYAATLNYPDEKVCPRDNTGPAAKVDENRCHKLIHLVISPGKTRVPGKTVKDGPFSALKSCASSRDQQKEICAPEQLRYDRGKSSLRAETFAGEEARGDKPPPPAAARAPHQNEFRLGWESVPEKPWRYTLGYTRTGLTSGDTLSGQIGLQSQLLGDIRYERDYVAFDLLNRRLRISVRGFSDYTPNRTLPAGSADERRTGGEMQAGLDLWRDQNGSSARLDVGASWRESQTKQEGRETTYIGIAHFDGGLTYFKAWDGTPGSARLEIIPSFTLGESSEESTWFIKPAISARYHRFVGSFIQWDMRGRAVTTAGTAPDVELPSFGGEDTVRGYKPDAALARTVWALQNEIWFPARLDFGLPDGLAKFLRRNVAMAVFADVGGAHESKGALSGIRGGAGAGLRLVWQDYLTLRLDWAHHIGSDADTGAGGMFFLTASTWQGF